MKEECSSTQREGYTPSIMYIHYAHCKHILVNEVYFNHYDFRMELQHNLDLFILIITKLFYSNLTHSHSYLTS